MHRRAAVVLCAATLAVATAFAVNQPVEHAPVGKAIARAYIAGMEAGDLEKLNALFLDENRSSILENASDEGSWEHYRDHHLKPEMQAAQNFRFKIAKESEERFDTTTLVRQTGSFTVEVRGEQRRYRVAVSYVIIAENGEHRIAHLHWSSRPDQRPQGGG